MYQRNLLEYAIEVKSTKRFETKSLVALNNKYQNIRINTFVMSTKTYNKEINEYNIPIYMLPFI